MKENAARQERLTLDGPAGRLEAVLHTPASPPTSVAVVAHPHPLYGGTMDNAVVLASVLALVERGAAVLRFNFRGVGASAGSHDRGRAEVDDLGAAVECVLERHAGLPLWIAGYSFGAAVLFGAVRRGFGWSRAPSGLLALAPPITHYDLSFLEENRVPLALVCGEEDTLTPRGELERQRAAWGDVASVLWLEGAGHDLGSFSNPEPLRAVLLRSLDVLGMGARRFYDTAFDAAGA